MYFDCLSEVLVTPESEVNMVSNIEPYILTLCLNKTHEVSAYTFKEKILSHLCVVSDSKFTFVENFDVLLLRSLDYKVAFCDINLAVGVFNLLALSIEDIRYLFSDKALDVGCNFLHGLTKLCAQHLEVSLCRIRYEVLLVLPYKDRLNIELFLENVYILLENLSCILIAAYNDKFLERLTNLEVGLSSQGASHLDSLHNDPHLLFLDSVAFTFVVDRIVTEVD